MTTGLTLHIARYAGGARQLPHSHDELHLSMVLAGGVTEAIAGRTELLGTGSIVCKDPGVVHANAWGDEGAVLARLSIGQGLGDIGDRAPAAPWTWAHDVSLAAPFLRIVSRARASDTSVAIADADVSDLLASLTARPASAVRGAPPAWLRDVMAQVRDGWHPGLTVASVAGSAGVHPVYLARCVRRWYGVTAGDELRRARMRHAMRSLAAEAVSVSRVAHEAGFADEPHLCRSVRAAAGITPRQLRAVVRHAVAVARPVTLSA
jgi:AraC family transcriptional regulator